MKIKPYQATIKLRYFIDRVKRLKKDKYTNKRFKTYDTKRLIRELNHVDEWCLIASNNKNNVDYVIGVAKTYKKIAIKLL